MKSPIYWHPTVYNTFIRILYRENFTDRYAELSDLILPNSDVLEVCCGDCFLYNKHLKKNNIRYRGIDANKSFTAFYEKSNIDVQIADIFFDEIPEADYIIIQGSLYQFAPFCKEIIDKLLTSARKQVIICEPIKNLSSSSNKLIANIASLASSVGDGAISFRFNESTFDKFLNEKYPELILNSQLTAGGREKVVILNAEGFEKKQDFAALADEKKRLTSKAKTTGVYNSLYHIAIVFAWVGFLAFFLQKLHLDWWFEDDPGIYHTAASAPSPLSFFLERHWFLSNNPNELVPFLLSSFWIDSWIAPRSATFAYYHNIFSFLCAALAFYFLLKKIFNNSLKAMAICIAWTSLRSTLVINEYLSTRCYMEGFAFGCVALLCTFKLIERKRFRLFYAIPVIVFTVLAMLSKEFFPPVLLTVQFGLMLWFGFYAWSLLPVGMGVFYLLYRNWVVGLKVSYGMPFLTMDQYLLFLKKLPIYLYGSTTGYVYLSLLACGFIYITLFHRQKSALPWLLLSLILLSLATIFPISFALLHNWNNPGTWLRSGFVIRSLILVFAASTMFSVFSRRIQILAFLLYLSWNLSASIDVTKKWDEMKLKYQVVGHFAVSHPGNNPIAVDLPARWFIPQLYILYPEAPRRMLLANPDKITASEIPALRQFKTLWIYQDGKMVKDTDSFLKLTDSSNKM